MPIFAPRLLHAPSSTFDPNPAFASSFLETLLLSATVKRLAVATFLSLNAISVPTVSACSSHTLEAHSNDLSPADTLFNLDFEDRDVEKWGLDMEKEGDFYFDIQQPDSWALRVLEVADQGVVKVKYLPTFHLEPGSSYRITFLAKSNKKDIEPFDLIRTVIYRGDQTIYEAFPEYPAQYIGGWHQFYTRFTVREGQGGEASFMFKIYSSGSELDWYFDGLALQKV